MLTKDCIVSITERMPNGTFSDPMINKFYTRSKFLFKKIIIFYLLLKIFIDFQGFNRDIQVDNCNLKCIYTFFSYIVLLRINAPPRIDAPTLEGGKNIRVVVWEKNAGKALLKTQTLDLNNKKIHGNPFEISGKIWPQLLLLLKIIE